MDVGAVEAGTRQHFEKLLLTLRAQIANLIEIQRNPAAIRARLKLFPGQPGTRYVEKFILEAV